MKKIVINTFREAYDPEDVRETMTVGELIDFLENLDEDAKIVLSFDNGDTYGGIPL